MGLFSDRRRLTLVSPEVDAEDQLHFRVVMLGAVVVLLFAVLSVQLVRLQILLHDEFETQATINRVRETLQPAERGLIVDRNGTLLVENVPAFSISVVPADVPAEETRQLAAQLAGLLDIPAFEIEERILAARRSVDPFLPMVLYRDATPDLAFAVAARRDTLPGVQVDAVAKRNYLQGALLSSVLGYIGPITRKEFDALQADRYLLSDRIGQTGVEASYESILRGVPGQRQEEVNASGRELRTLSEEPPTSGRGLAITINLELQAATEQILVESMGGSLFASAVVVDVHTGEVLALVSVPTYDNNIFSGYLDDEELAAILADEGRPLVNHAIADQFPSGSIFKVITGTAALEEGVITPEQQIFSAGVIEVQNEVDPRITYTFRDTTSGTFDFIQGLAESSNVYFWYLAGGSPFRRPVAEELLTPEQLAEQQRQEASGVIGGDQDFSGLGVDRIAKWAREFGLDTPSGIDLTGEAAGFIPDAEWKLRTFGEQWGQGDSYNLGIGQGFVAMTPIQMAMVTAAIANGGTVLEPRVVHAILDQDGNEVEVLRPQVKNHMDVDPETLDTVRRGMAMAVLAGTAGNAWFPEMLIAGKTGTAEFGDNRLFRGLFPTHGWFLGFAPFNDPQVAVVVFHELGAGFLSAGPGGEILRAWAQITDAVDPEQPALPQRRSIEPEEFQRLVERLP